MNKKYYVERIENKMKRLERKKKAAKDDVEKSIKDEKKCIESVMRLFKKFSKASELASDKKNTQRKTADTKTIHVLNFGL